MSVANHFRPQSIDQLLGQTKTLKILQSYMQEPVEKFPHVLIFTSEAAGVGKTTLGRLIGKHLQAEVLEYNCGSDSNIDKLRDLVTSSREQSMFSDRKLIIMDEVQKASKAAQDVFLKDLEDHGSHIYWVFCTTEVGKILPTLLSRGIHLKLEGMAREDAKNAIRRYCADRKMRVDKEAVTPLVNHIYQESNNSFRQLFVEMDKLFHYIDKDEKGQAAITVEVLEKYFGSSVNEATYKLPQLFMDLGNFGELKTLKLVFRALEEEKNLGKQPYGVLSGLYNYLRKVFLGSEKEDFLVFTLGAISAKLETKEIDWVALENLALKLYSMKGKK